MKPRATDAAKLRALYPTRDDYVAKVSARVEALVAQRFLTSADGARILEDARLGSHHRGDTIDDGP